MTVSAAHRDGHTAGHRVEQFMTAASAVGAVCVSVPTTDDATDHVLQTLRDMRPPGGALLRVGASAGVTPAVEAMLQREQHSGMLQLFAPSRLTDTALFSLDVGITGGQWGIADTGSLVLQTGGERNRMLSLVPPVHIALLRVRDILATGSELWRLVHDRRQSRMTSLHDGTPHTLGGAITCITGPSRTSDIELILVIGVHGPRHLHIVLYDDPPTPIL